MEKRIYIGVDIAQESFEAGLWQTKGGQPLGHYPNRQEGWELLAKTLRKDNIEGQGQILLVLEATGGYELGLAAYAYAQNWQVCLPNPKTVRDWAKGSGWRSKSDRQDALMLAQYGSEKQPAPQDELPPHVRELDDLLRRRTDIEQVRQSENNRLKGYQQRPHPSQPVIQSLERSIASLDAELTALEQAIKELVNGNLELKQRVRQLRTVPGVGTRIALPLLVILYRWQARTQGQGSAKGLVAFLGLDPQTFQSGTSVYKRATISRMGDGHIRSLLYMGALGGIRGDNPLRIFYQRLVGRNKAKRLALVASARKILVWAWAVFHSNSNFDSSLFAPSPA